MTSALQPPAGEERINREFFTAALGDSLARGESVWLRVRGASMRPWLREGDRIRIRPAAGGRLRRGDIALFWRGPGRPILHRVVRVRREAGAIRYDCLGDAESGPPETVPAPAVIGVVAAASFHRWRYLALNPARRWFHRLCRRWELRRRHG